MTILGLFLIASPLLSGSPKRPRGLIRFNAHDGDPEKDSSSVYLGMNLQKQTPISLSFFSAVTFIIAGWMSGLTAQHQVASEIREAFAASNRFSETSLFKSVQYHAEFLTGDRQSVKNVITAYPEPSVCLSIVRTKPDYLRFELPLPGEEKSYLLLMRQEIFSPDARMTTQDDRTGIPLQGGAYYKGIIEGDEGSLAAISIFGDQIMGVVSNQRLGNIVIGKQEVQSINRNSIPHVIYQESALPQHNPFQCAADELNVPPMPGEAEPGAVSTYPSRCKSVKIFLECSNRLYTDRGSSQGAVEAYMTGLFNVVKTLYGNEKVVIEISEIMVWTTPDPYLKTNLSNILYDYANRRKNNFNGTLAQLVTTYPIQQQGGIAFVDGLCKTWDGQSGPLSFAFINNNYSSLPTYSWSVEVMTHEMGHNFGSWHTHSCVWGPNKDSQIDNCQPADVGSCNNGAAPVGGGTIMSYCHLTSYGISFSKGFGTEPGDVLRNSFATKPCIPSSFSPIASHNIKGPYFEGDSFRLSAKPYSKNYKYEWLHHDYIFNKNNDTAITVRKSGIYTLAISSSNCTEYAKPDTVKFADFAVNLGCPVIRGQRDSLYKSVMLNVDNAAYTDDSLQVPEGWLDSVPANALDRLVELQMTITPKGASFTRSVVSKYESPAAIGIRNDSYTPNDQVAFGQKSPTTFTRVLGDFDPKGVWKFSGIDIRNDAGIDAVVEYKVVLSWRLRDSVVSCDIPLCDNRPLPLDAGIPNASYQWSTGAKTRAISVNQPGPVSVSVTRNGFTARHEINLYPVKTSFPRNVSICEGDSVSIKNHVYKTRGIYRDTLRSASGCDSIVITDLEVRPVIRTDEMRTVCYASVFRNSVLRKDTAIVVSGQAANGCDSLHTVHFQVNPAITAELHYDPACDDEGTELSAEGRGGSGTLHYRWSTGDTVSVLQKIKSGSYRVSVTDEKGCEAVFTEELRNFDSVTVDAQITDLLCFGGRDGGIRLDVLTGKAPFAYNWNDGTRAPVLKDLQAGRYDIVIFDANGCRYEGTYTLKSPNLLLVTGDARPSFGSNGSIVLTTDGGVKPYRYNWSQGDTTDMLANLVPGTYTVTVTDANGCTNVQSYEVQNKVSTRDPGRESPVSLSPVPASGTLRIHSTEKLLREVTMINAFGQKIIRDLPGGTETVEIDLSGMAPGYYTVEVRLEGGAVVVRKLLKY